jgi:phenylalanyl-tRNA synthetase beta chain
VDLVEEVARVVGYEKIPVRDEISIRLTPRDPAARTIDRIRDTLVAAGYFESITFSFVSDALAGDFLPHEAMSLPRAEPGTRKADARLRPSILPGLLESLLRNEHAGAAGAKLFEMGSVFHVDAAGKIVEQRKLAMVGGEDVRQVRGAVESLLSALDAAKPIKVIPDARAGFAAGALGRIEWGGTVVGSVGKIDRSIAEKLSLRTVPVAAELLVEPLLALAQPVPQLRELPRYPAVRRDLSTVLPEATPYEALDALIRGLSPADLEDVEYVTTYRGKPLDAGQKSVTVTLVFRSAAGTLIGEAVEAAVKKIVAAIKEQLGGTLRE